MPQDPLRYTRVQTAAGAVKKDALPLLRQMFAVGKSPQAISGKIRQMFPNLREGEGSILYYKAKEPYTAAKALQQAPGEMMLPPGDIPPITGKPGTMGLGDIPGFHFRVTITYQDREGGDLKFWSTHVYSSQNRSNLWVLNQAKMAWAADMARGAYAQLTRRGLDNIFVKGEIRSVYRRDE